MLQFFGSIFILPGKRFCKLLSSLVLGSGLLKDVSLLGFLLESWAPGSCPPWEPVVADVGLGTACSAMPWEQHLENRPTLVQRGCLDWLPEQGVSLVGVIADRDSEGTEHCNRILGRCAHFYSFETKTIPYGLNVVLMLRGVTKIDSRVTGSKYCVRDRDTSRR